VQIFGNNEYYEEWLEFIKFQGITVNEDGQYNGEITDFMGALVVVEKITLRLNKEHDELEQKWNGKLGIQKIQKYFDFTYIPDKFANVDSPVDELDNSLFDSLKDMVENSYALLPYTFYSACEDLLDRDHIFSTPGHFHCYKLKDGESIHVEAS
jgi:hypothetical protein